MLAILSAECPLCNSRKQRGACFCDRCYYKLPKREQKQIKNALRALSEVMLGEAGIRT